MRNNAIIIKPHIILLRTHNEDSTTQIAEQTGISVAIKRFKVPQKYKAKDCFGHNPVTQHHVHIEGPKPAIRCECVGRSDWNERGNQLEYSPGMYLGLLP